MSTPSTVTTSSIAASAQKASPNTTASVSGSKTVADQTPYIFPTGLEMPALPGDGRGIYMSGPDLTPSAEEQKRFDNLCNALRTCHNYLMKSENSEVNFSASTVIPDNKFIELNTRVNNKAYFYLTTGKKEYYVLVNFEGGYCCVLVTDQNDGVHPELTISIKNNTLSIIDNPKPTVVRLHSPTTANKTSELVEDSATIMKIQNDKLVANAAKPNFAVSSTTNASATDSTVHPSVDIKTSKDSITTVTHSASKQFSEYCAKIENASNYNNSVYDTQVSKDEGRSNQDAAYYIFQGRAACTIDSTNPAIILKRYYIIVKKGSTENPAPEISLHNADYDNSLDNEIFSADPNPFKILGLNSEYVVAIEENSLNTTVVRLNPKPTLSQQPALTFSHPAALRATATDPNKKSAAELASALNKAGATVTTTYSDGTQIVRRINPIEIVSSLVPDDSDDNLVRDANDNCRLM